MTLTFTLNTRYPSFRKTTAVILKEPGIELCKAMAIGDVEYLERLVSHDVDPNAVDYTQSTPLHIAAATGVPHAVELLVSKGADVLAQNWHGSTPHDEAKHSESEETVKILEEQMLARCQQSSESNSI
ncbi:hypothetical protein O6H91_13G020100 [Diphasiastrum complanatum]|uniref:Uncharacterized protein n=1 Tax=Diphasiastrum complanatum TaxID=34168 RepID=A0ACC2BSQ1_DIPCM|nr:hypothetical protein O6H91_13G020100 [Diphasiastrum complanatum]